MAGTAPSAIVLEDREPARALAARLACVAHLATADWFLVCVARLLGATAALNGDRLAARAYYVQALESAGKIGFRPEIALTHLQLAELLLEEGNGPVAGGRPKVFQRWYPAFIVPTESGVTQLAAWPPPVLFTLSV